MATLALAALVWIGSAATTSLFVSASWLLLRKQIRLLHPVTRGRTLGAVAIAPCGLATLVVILCFVPGVLEWLGIIEGHCTQHADHPHLCMVHPTAVLTPPLVGVLVLVTCSLHAKLVVG